MTAAFRLWLLVLLTGLLPAVAVADRVPTASPRAARTSSDSPDTVAGKAMTLAPGVTLTPWTRDDADRPIRAWAVRVDLQTPGLDLDVAFAGPDPDGDGPWQTSIRRTSEVTREEGFVVAINASFFNVAEATAVPGGTAYVAGTPARVLGYKRRDGGLIHGDRWGATFVIDADGRARIPDPRRPIPPNAREAVSGSSQILYNGRTVVPANPGRLGETHPRTAVGLSDDGRTVWLIVVDGRRAGWSVGMDLQELADFLKTVGCVDAINLDGGGSSTLAVRGEDGRVSVVNRPSDGGNLPFAPSLERPVANVIGVSVTPTVPADEDR